MLRKNTLPYFIAIIFGCLFHRPARCDDAIPREDLPINWQSDAELTDVFFLNEALGWAVGAQGVVLRTTNGGEDWSELSQAPAPTGPHLSLSEKYQALRSGAQTPWTGVANGSNSQHKPIRCRFESVHFVDTDHGWIAGGYDLPYINHSRGFILKTSDGGVSWRPISGLFMSRINRINFSDRANGWAIGESSNLFPRGIGFTSDGGETWSSHTFAKLDDWIEGEQTSSGFVNLDGSGHPVVLGNNQVERSVFLNNQTAALTMIRMVDDQQGWAVGNFGSILQTENAGLSWKSLVSASAGPTTADPESVALNNLLRQFDFNSLAISPGKIWVAGSPGSVVFSIDRQTGAISTSTTGVALPINDLHFVDDENGWAVGALGMIMSTADGGNSWQIQHGQHRSVALLGVAVNENELPLEAIANFAGEENRVAAVAVLQSSVNPATRQSIERLGGTLLLPISRIAEHGDQQSSHDRNLEAMVRAIRTLRPNVIISNSRLRTATDNPESFLKTAIRAAAERTAFPDQIELARLEPWSVDRLATRDLVGSVTIDPKRMLPRTGSLIEDKIALSRALLELPLAAIEAPVYRVEHYSIANHTKSNDLFAGLVQLGRRVPTRDADQGFRGSLNAIQLANSKQVKLDEFAKFDLNGSQDLRVWNQQMLSWALSLEENVAGVWLAQLAQRYLEQGKTELAANTFEVLANRLYNHPLAPAAVTWLIQYYASDEFGQIAFRRWDQTRRQQHEIADHRRADNVKLGNPATKLSQSYSGGVSQLIWTPVPDAIRTAESIRSDDDSLFETELTALQDDVTSELDLTKTDNRGGETISLTPEEIESFFQSRWQRAGQYLSQLGQRDPDLVGGSQYKLLEAQILRKLNGSLAAEAILKQLVQKREADTTIAVSAKIELDLAGLSSHSPLAESVTCLQTSTRPRLDGLLDDDIWQTLLANESVLRLVADQAQGDGQTPADIVMLAHDDQFLYVAVHCQKIAQQYYQTSNDARPRDADLFRRDRISLAFDVDRDYRSTNEFMIDYRGWCRDQCSGAVGWNPDWYISQSDDVGSWTIELAIPLDQIIARPISADSVWSIRLARMINDDSNLWNKARSPLFGVARRDASEERQQRAGIQIGLAANPADFRLLRFK